MCVQCQGVWISCTMTSFDWVSRQLVHVSVLPLLCLCFEIVAREAASSCSIEYPENAEVVTLHQVLPDSYLICEMRLFQARTSSGQGIAQCVASAGTLAAVKVEPVWRGIHRGIECNSSHVMQVQVEYLHTNGSYVRNDTFIQSRVDTDMESKDGASRSMYQLAIRTETFTEDSAPVRYTIRGRAAEGDGAPGAIIALLMSFRKPPVSDEDQLIGIYTRNGQNEFLALDEVVIVPCLDIGQAYIPPNVYHVLVEGYSCHALRLLPPIFRYDFLSGIHFNMSRLLNYSRGGSRFLCCAGPDPLGEGEGCSPTPPELCVAFSIKDPPDLVVIPDTRPSGHAVDLLSTREDDPIQVYFECNYKSHIYLTVSHYKGSPAKGAGRIGGDGGYSIPSAPASHSTTNSTSTWDIRHRASAVTAVRVGDSVFGHCSTSDQGLPRDLHVWWYVVRDAERQNSNTSYLRVSLKSASPVPSEKEIPVRVFRCESAHADLRLRVVRCADPLHCSLLEWCLEVESAKECASWDEVRSGQECATVDARRAAHCLEVEVPSSPGLFRCTAGAYTFTQLRWLGLSGARSYAYRDADFSNATLKDEIIQMGGPPEDILYTHATYKFTCRVARFWSGGRLRFWFDFQGNESLLEPVRALESGFYIAGEENTHNEWVETKIPSPIVDRVICAAPKSDTEDRWISTGLAVRVVQSARPRILNDANETALAFAKDAGSAIVCECSGQPPPSMKWVTVDSVGQETEITPDQEADVHVVQAGHRIALTFRRFTAEQARTYVCSVLNDLGQDSREFEVSLLPAENTSEWVILGGAAAGAVLVLVAGAALAYRVHFRSQPRRVVSEVIMKTFRFGISTEDGDAEFEHVSDISSSSAVIVPAPNLSTHGTTVEAKDSEEQRIEGEATANAAEAVPTPAWQQVARLKPFDVMFEIERQKFTYDKGNPLGSGRYGRVYAGLLSCSDPPICVAVKVPHPGSSEDVLESYLTEIKIMTKLRHESIVSMVGACTGRAEFGKVYILMEFCEHGSIDKFLKRYACYYAEADVDKNETNAEVKAGQHSNYASMIPTALRFGYADLLRWSMEIASGMEFLAGMGMVHRHLAARNALLSAGLHAKVSDFGLTRQLYGSLAYTQKTLGLELPYRWMAPECFQGTFSTSSDVWAYAVLVWEVFSFGEVPYPSVGFTAEQVALFPAFLGAGLRIKEPRRASTRVFSKLSECWAVTPEDRPSFTELKDFFLEAIHKPEE